MRYAFVRAQEDHYPVRRLCRMMQVHPSGYYAWRAEPLSVRAKEDRRLSGLIKQFWLESGGVYGYRKITDDLHEVGESCGKHRVYRRHYAPRQAIGGVQVSTTAVPRWSPPTMSSNSSMFPFRIRCG